MVGPCHAIRLRPLRRNSLIVARQRSLEAASEPQRAEGKSPLRVGDMVHNLPDAPAVRRVAMDRSLFGNPVEHSEGFMQLPFDNGARIIARDLIDISEIITCGF